MGDMLPLQSADSWGALAPPLRSAPLGFSSPQCLSMGTGVECILRLGAWNAWALAVGLGQRGDYRQGTTDTAILWSSWQQPRTAHLLFPQDGWMEGTTPILLTLDCESLTPGFYSSV